MSSNSELFYLKWNNFQKNVSTQFQKLRDNLDLIDITFACGGKKLGAHKLVLFACSPFFQNLLQENQSPHPIFFFNDVKFDVLKAILDYMYLGEVHITNENLKDFIKTAEALQIRGLSKDSNNDGNLCSNTPTPRDENTSENIQIEDYGRKRSAAEETVLQNYNETKRMRNEGSTTILDEEEEEDECEDLEIPIIRRKHNHHLESLEPKVELFGDDYLDQKPTQATYCNMDTFTEKTDFKNTIQQDYVATTSQVTGDYKSEDEIWDKATLDIGSNSSHSESSPGKLSKAKLSAAAANNRANCLTPRSCPVCARVYSNVSNLRQHMRLIHNPTAVICPICSKHFNSDLYLKRHYASIHSINSGAEVEEGKVVLPANGTATWSTGYASGEVTNLIQQ